MSFIVKVLIMGSGGVGGYFGGLLARNGHDVTFIARGQHLKAINKNGLLVESSNNGRFNIECKAISDTNGIESPDLIIFSVKMFQNIEAIKLIMPCVSPDTIILSLQNGIDNGEILSEYFDPKNVMIGSAFLEGRVSSPGTITQGGPGIAAFGEQFEGLTERGEYLKKVFEAANWDVELHENMRGVLWKKFAYLVAGAAVCAASHCDYGSMRSNPETRSLILKAISEVLEVGKAMGEPIMEDSLDWAENSLDRFPGLGKASMAKDFLEGKPVELEGLTGKIIRLGREYNVETPINDILYAILKPWAIHNTSGNGR